MKMLGFLGGLSYRRGTGRQEAYPLTRASEAPKRQLQSALWLFRVYNEASMRPARLFTKRAKKPSCLLKSFVDSFFSSTRIASSRKAPKNTG